MTLRSFALAPLFLSILWLGGAGAASADEAGLQRSALHDFRVVTVAEGFEHPWSLLFLPDGGILVTERDGRLYLLRGDQRTEVEGLPEIAASGQGGLLDVVAHPGFAENRLIYFTYSGRGDGGLNTRLARARLDGTRLADLELLLETRPISGNTRHFGSRLQFDGQGHLFMTVGDRGDADEAQVLGNHAGTVLRLTEAGTVPPDNPFVGQAGARPEIWSYGHRNPQGLTQRRSDGTIWAIEHGPRGGDELNLVERGVNYGWPVITYGRAYSGLSIGEGKEKAGLAQPARYWVPSISPSGLAFYDGDAFPKWQGSLFAGALSGELLVRLTLEGDRVVGEERLLEDLEERIRDVRQGPDGRLYLLTDSSDGRLLRLEPAT